MEAMMNVSLTPDLEERLLKKVESGDYASTGEVIREALDRFFAEDRARAALIAELNAQIDAGLAECDRGELLDGEQVFAEILARYGSDKRL